MKRKKKSNIQREQRSKKEKNGTPPLASPVCTETMNFSRLEKHHSTDNEARQGRLGWRGEILESTILLKRLQGSYLLGLQGFSRKSCYCKNSASKTSKNTNHTTSTKRTKKRWTKEFTPIVRPFTNGLGATHHT